MKRSLQVEIYRAVVGVDAFYVVAIEGIYVVDPSPAVLREMQLIAQFYVSTADIRKKAAQWLSAIL